MSSSRRAYLKFLKLSATLDSIISQGMGYAFSLLCIIVHLEILALSILTTTMQVFITEGIQSSAAYRKSVKKMKNAVRQAADLLGKHSIPFW